MSDLVRILDVTSGKWFRAPGKGLTLDKHAAHIYPFAEARRMKAIATSPVELEPVEPAPCQSISAATGLSTPEPAPIHNDKPATWELVIADMRERDASGRAKYGTPLQPFNGRSNLTDLYQELLDAVVYTRNEIEERKQPAPCPKCAELAAALEDCKRELEDAYSFWARFNVSCQAPHIEKCMCAKCMEQRARSVIDQCGAVLSGTVASHDAAKDAEIERLRGALETIEAVCLHPWDIQKVYGEDITAPGRDVGVVLVEQVLPVAQSALKGGKA